jgi:hypothetical protein
MKTLEQLDRNQIIIAINELKTTKYSNKNGKFHTLRFEGFTFSPNIVIKKALELGNFSGNWTGGDGKYGSITYLKELKFKIETAK